MSSSVQKPTTTFVDESARGLARELNHVADAINESRRLLALAPDWDGEGGVAISEHAWRQATTFVTNNARWVLERLGVAIDAPAIQPGPSGSVDLHWDHPDYELLINVPAQPGARAGFYGDDRSRVAIKGTLDLDAYNLGLLLWLAKIK